jgi:uncharacterized protein (TIGR02118 family)
LFIWDTMIKFVIAFRQPQRLEPFENAYNDLLALVERMPGIERRQVVNVLASPTGEAPFYRLLELYFADQSAMAAALRAPAGQEAGAELGRRFEGGTYHSFYAEVYEETGGSTPTT